MQVSPHGVPLVHDGALVGGQIVEVQVHETQGAVVRQAAEGQVALTVGAAAGGHGGAGVLELRRGQQIHHRLGGGQVGGVLHDGGSAGHGGVALRHIDALHIGGAVIDQGGDGGLIGQTGYILAVDDQVVDVLGGGGGEAQRHQLGDVVPALVVVELVAHNSQDGLDLTPAGGGSVGRGQDDLPVEGVVDQVVIPLDFHAQLGLQGGVDDQAHDLDVIERVVAGLVVIELLRVAGGGVGLQDVVVGIAVRREHAADDHIGVALLVAPDSGGQGADRVSLDLDLTVGIILAPQVHQDLLLGLLHGGVDGDLAGDGGGVADVVGQLASRGVASCGIGGRRRGRSAAAAAAGGSAAVPAAAGGQGEGHSQGQKQRYIFFHVSFLLFCLS